MVDKLRLGKAIPTQPRIGDDMREIGLARTGRIIAHCFVLVLVVLSIFEVFRTLAGVIQDLDKGNELFLLGVFAAALVPSAAMLYWACNAIVADIYLTTRKVRRYLGLEYRGSRTNRCSRVARCE